MIEQKIFHDSAFANVTGKSSFVDDRMLLQNEVYVDVICSPVSSGILKTIHTKQALEVPGVLAVFTAKDFKQNLWGTIKKDQPLLVDKEINYHHEPICILVAENKWALKKAKKLIHFDIKETKSVISLSDSIVKKSFLYSPKPYNRGNIAEAFKNAPHTLSGEFHSGAQEHFYLETQATVAYPIDNNQIEIHSSTQHPTETQHICAKALGVNYSQVTCVVKRMGGAFGGKESQAAPFAAYVALAASKLNRPARICLLQEEDFSITGKRHPFQSQYDVSFDDKGIILGLKAYLYADGGAYTDLSPSILDRALYHLDGCYFIENMYAEGHVCKTNTHSNTAFRGFGGPQGNLLIESIIEDIAIYLKKDSFEIRTINLYQKENRNFTHYGQKVDNNLLPEIFQSLYNSSKYYELRAETNQWNKSHPEKVRGLAMTGVKFGIAFTARFLNQGSAIVNIHRDGTVQVSTGATEMGQGVNTKIQQIVAHTFKISSDWVRMMPTSTEKNHNTSPTAASSGTDINGAAALMACEKIMQRLNEFKNSIGSESTTWEWKKLIDQAYLNRIFLGEYAYYKTELLNDQNPFRYFTMGAAVSQVEVDIFTGELKVLRSDILMDLGRTINPGIDHGQITGGFIQGMGWLTTENIYHNEKGVLLSRSPTTYKIPNIQDIPRIFNVHFFENNLHNESVFKAKAVGEPPLLLAASVFTAIKNALGNIKSRVNLKAPATPENILAEIYQK